MDMYSYIYLLIVPIVFSLSVAISFTRDDVDWYKPIPLLFDFSIAVFLGVLWPLTIAVLLFSIVVFAIVSEVDRRSKF